MGARRYTTDYGRFIAQDSYSSAAADLGLTLAPLTQNRYAYGGSNPIGQIEVDGHRVAPGNPPRVTSPPHIQDYLNQYNDLLCESWYELPENRLDCNEIRRAIEECRGCPGKGGGLWFLDFVPVIGEIKGGIDCIKNPGPLTCAGAIPIAGRFVRGTRLAVHSTRMFTKKLRVAKKGSRADSTPWLVFTDQLPGGREEADKILETIRHIDRGTVAPGVRTKKWGTQWKNYPKKGQNVPRLPGPRGNKSPYYEYDVLPARGIKKPGPRRIVRNEDTGATYYTWTHYGDEGDPAFVRIR
jgi:guanyl-specific ribonuclease Sa